jgi:DNA gyrase subunit A
MADEGRLDRRGIKHGNNGERKRNASVLEQPLDRFMEDAYRRYAVLTILDRALPDVRDGLKPVQRRILYAMGDMNLNANTRTANRRAWWVKCWASTTRTATSRSMTRWCAWRRIFDAHAADRWAGQLRLDRRRQRGSHALYRSAPGSLGEGMLEDLEKDTVDWRPNFDGSLREPTVLPARFPNLLVNGATGIAVGMSTNILPHNLGEVCDAVVYMAKNWARATRSSCRADEVYPRPRPAHRRAALPLPGGADEKKVDMIQRAYETGNATLVCQAKADIQDIGGGKSEIIVTELPFRCRKPPSWSASLPAASASSGITDVRDESDFKGMRIVFEVARGQTRGSAGTACSATPPCAQPVVQRPGAGGG